MNLKLKDLNKISKSLGLPKYGAKASVLNEIQRFLEKSKHYSKSSRLVSIDTGYTNLAFSEFQLFDLKGAKNVHLLNWALVDANVSNEYQVANFASQARKIIDNHLWSNDPTIYLIERQSLRPIGVKRSVPHAIIKLAIFEALLFGILSEKCSSTSSSMVESISSVSVSNHWNLTSNTYKLKKNQAVNLIKDWLKEGCTNNNTTFQVPPELQDYFSKSSKKDDLADSLLMGLAFLEWSKSATHLLQNNNSAGQNFISTVQKSTTLNR